LFDDEVFRVFEHVASHHDPGSPDLAGRDFAVADQIFDRLRVNVQEFGGFHNAKSGRIIHSVS
jgi:hypothetical protein